MPGAASAFYRVLFGFLALLPFLLNAIGKGLRIGRSSILLAFLGGAFFAGDIALFNSAVLQTSASSAAFLANNAPFFVAMLAWAATRKLPRRRFWVAFALALAGATLIMAVDKHHSRSGFAADGMAVVASICFALYLAVTERLRGSYPALVLVAISTGSSALVLLLYATLTHVSLRISSLSSLFALIGLGCLCQVIGYFCLTYSLGHLPATSTSIVLLAVAPFTAVLAFALFGERITVIQVVGNGMVLAGVWIVSNRGRSDDGAPIPFAQPT